MQHPRGTPALFDTPATGQPLQLSDKVANPAAAMGEAAQNVAARGNVSLQGQGHRTTFLSALLQALGAWQV